MPVYQYTALDKRGKKIKSTIEARSLDLARTSLRGAGYSIMDLKEQSVMNSDITLPFLGKPKAKDLAVFCRQFLSILRAGVPVNTALGMLGQQTANRKLATAIRALETEVEQGSTLAGAMRRQSVFPPILSNMVMAGESSGNLEDAFEQMVVYFERAQKTSNKVGQVLIYPAVLTVVMVIVLFVMMTRIIPSFLATFEEMGAELPYLTQLVMHVSDFFVAWWWLIAIVLIALIAFLTAFRFTDPGRHFYGLLARKLPVLKTLTVNSASATFCRILSVLLGSGLTLPEALSLTSGNLSNIYFREALARVQSRVVSGWPLNAALKEVRIFPNMVCNMTAIGEESGELQEMLAKTADYYDQEVEDSTEKLMSLMEPLTILFMAFFVVIIVLSIFLPMVNMIHAYDAYL